MYHILSEHQRWFYCWRLVWMQLNSSRLCIQWSIPTICCLKYVLWNKIGAMEKHLQLSLSWKSWFDDWNLLGNEAIRIINMEAFPSAIMSEAQSLLRLLLILGPQTFISWFSSSPLPKPTPTYTLRYWSHCWLYNTLDLEPTIWICKTWEVCKQGLFAFVFSVFSHTHTYMHIF